MPAHRLLIGDCRDPEAYRRLFGDRQPDTLVFDPPFQWERVYEWLPERQEHHHALLVFTDAFRLAEALRCAEAKGWPFRFELIWDGLSSWFTEGRPLARHKSALLFGDFDWNFGAGVYLNDEGEEKHLTTVYPQANSGVEGGHNHAKPARWLQAMLAGVGASLVWDLCAGAGSVAVAAERIGATVYGCEIDPAVGDGWLKRLETATGTEARMLEAGPPGAAPDLPATKDPRRYARSTFYRTKKWRQLRAAALERDGNRCVECRQGPGHGRLNVDHLIPREEGGADELANLRTLCQAYHSRKTAATQPAGFAAGG